MCVCVCAHLQNRDTPLFSLSAGLNSTDGAPHYDDFSLIPSKCGGAKPYSFFFSNPVARMNVSTTFCFFFFFFSACGLHTADNGSWKGKKRRTLAYPRTIVGHLCDVLQNSRLHSAAALLQKKKGAKKKGGETMERRMRIAYTHTHTRTQEESRNKRERAQVSIGELLSMPATQFAFEWVGE